MGAIGYFTLIRPANVTIDDPTPPARQTERNDAQWTAPVLQPEPIEVPAVEEEPAPEPEDLLPQVVSPLDGTTVTVFSTTELMYDETMADWRTHNGTDYTAEQVTAVAAGTVTAIADDALWGRVVEVTDAQDRVWRYCGLEEVAVTQREKVTAGTRLGTTGNVPAEAQQGSHLHLECRKAGACLDPEKN